MKGTHFTILLVVITAVDVLVPYLWIGDMESLGASFLFWCALTLAVIVFAVAATRNWGRPV
ncbi:hypothetical protein HNR65_000893 [Desulfosalsimonas propionicica]|uniref:Uncharacterized protein n=1 Tax=Desulfosalsimonas propionicica TaxID=332175 RepID=A0A7W0C7F6_9BACT|nr:hypothetical protein [Desulfosalsimonas propionicica]MBA2880575.1 hypothetical protein [Desulfosalsimonas propionicica]